MWVLGGKNHWGTTLESGPHNLPLDSKAKYPYSLWIPLKSLVSLQHQLEIQNFIALVKFRCKWGRLLGCSSLSNLIKHSYALSELLPKRGVICSLPTQWTAVAQAQDNYCTPSHLKMEESGGSLEWLAQNNSETRQGALWLWSPAVPRFHLTRERSSVVIGSALHVLLPFPWKVASVCGWGGFSVYFLFVPV